MGWGYNNYSEVPPPFISSSIPTVTDFRYWLIFLWGWSVSGWANWWCLALTCSCMNTPQGTASMAWVASPPDQRPDFRYAGHKVVEGTVRFTKRSRLPHHGQPTRSLNDAIERQSWCFPVFKLRMCMTSSLSLSVDSFGGSSGYVSIYNQ